MEKVDLKIISKADLEPLYASEKASGADLKADLKEPLTLKPFQRALIPTSVYLEIPDGYEVQIRPRSGLAIKEGIALINSPGTIDSDYRGEVKVILINLGEKPFTISHGDRIAQMVLVPVVQANWVACKKLSQTQRGEGGFGSTGV